MAPNTSAISAAIAGMTVSGVTFKDVSGIPKIVRESDCPIFFPDPSDWFSSMKSAQTLNSPTNQTDVTRTLKYIYLHSVSTAANLPSTHYAGMAAKVDAIYSALDSIVGGLFVVTGITVSRFGEIEAPRQGQLRNVFFGCFFNIDIVETVNR
jgi:hypothetical protein